MKWLNLFVDIFCILAFLTLGSLMVIVTLQILPMEYALIKVQDLYESSIQRFRLGISGFLFIIIGLMLAKIFVKKAHVDDEFLVQGDQGHLVLTYGAINELVQRTLRKFDVIRKVNGITSRYEQNRIRIVVQLSVLSNCNLGELNESIRREIEERIHKMLGHLIAVELEVVISGIEESALELVHGTSVKTS